MIKRVLNKFKKKKKYNPIGLLNELNRNTWIEKTLKSIPQKSKILDAGAGEQVYKNICKHLNYVSQDFAQYNGQGDGKGLQTTTWDQTKLDIICDISNIPEPDASFDAIMCTEVLEHLPDPVLALKEFKRLLKPGGMLIITAPFCSLTHFSPYHFSTGFNKYYYQHHFNELGFQIDELVSNGNYFEYLAQEIRRLPSVAKTYSKKEFNTQLVKSQNNVLEYLQECSNNDESSSDFLCFGYHVLAHKK